MALPKRKQPYVDQVLKLVDQLSPTELNIVRKKIESKDWSTKWHSLFSEIDKQNKGLPTLSDEEIAAEVNAVRKELKSDRAKK